MESARRRRPGLASFLARAGLVVVVLLGLTVPPAGAATQRNPSSGYWVRAASAGKSLCGAALVTDELASKPEAWAFTVRLSNGNCTGSQTASDILGAKTVLQQSYAFVWVDCGEKTVAAGSSSVTAARSNGVCPESGQHWWRAVTTHGGWLGANFYDLNHWPLVTQAILW